MSCFHFLHTDRHPWKEEVECVTLGWSCPGLPRHARLCPILPYVALSSRSGAVNLEVTWNELLNRFLSLCIVLGVAKVLFSNYRLEISLANQIAGISDLISLEGDDVSFWFFACWQTSMKGRSWVCHFGLVMPRLAQTCPILLNFAIGGSGLLEWCSNDCLFFSFSFIFIFYSCCRCKIFFSKKQILIVSGARQTFFDCCC